MSADRGEETSEARPGAEGRGATKKMMAALGLHHVQIACAAGSEDPLRVTYDESIPGVRRFHTHDPVGNRLETRQA